MPHRDTGTTDGVRRGGVFAVPLILVIVSVGVLVVPTPSGLSPEAHRLMAVTVLMAGLWISQAIPLAVTSLLPLALFPLLAIRSPDEVSRAYANDTLFLYLGGMMIALGIERWDLHRRIALTLVSAIGVSPRRLVLGFLLTSALLSMWISNTACSLMMLPIALALLRILDEAQSEESGDGRWTGRAVSDTAGVSVLLAIAWGSSLGGMTTIVGTPTNSAAVGIFHRTYGDAQELTVARWLMACGPIGLVYLGITWVVLTRGLPGRTDRDAVLLSELRRRRAASGRATTAERRMFVVFVFTAVLWILRKPLQFGDVTVLPGWEELYAVLFDWLARLWSSESAAFPETRAISDTTVAMLLAVLLFVLPSGTRDVRGRPVPLMDWSTAVKLPWDIILLFGGGFAIAEAFDATGLSRWLGESLRGPLEGQPVWLIIAVLCLMMTFLTELTSNVATVSALLPAILALADAIDLDPRLLFIPATLATSCAFMLPIATPPNAIVFGSGRISMRQMTRRGLVLNLLGVPVLTAGALWLIQPILQIP